MFCVVITEGYDILVNSEKLIGTTEHLDAVDWALRKAMLL